MTHESGITIGIPAYNARKTLERAISSALDQTFQGDFEVLIVDDGSQDTTANIALAYALMHPDQVRLIRTPNRGVAAARNVIVREARFDHLTWLDADDYYYPEKLARQHDALMLWHMVGHTLPGDPALMVFSSFTMDGQTHRFAPYLADPEPAILSGRFRAYLWASLTATRAYFDVGAFNEDLHRSEDTDWLLRYLDLGPRIVATDGDPLIHYHFSTSRNGGAVEAAFSFMLERYGDRMKAHGIFDEHVPRRWWEISNFYASGGQQDDVWRCRANAARLDPQRYREKLDEEVDKLPPGERERARVVCMGLLEQGQLPVNR